MLIVEDVPGAENWRRLIFLSRGGFSGFAVTDHINGTCKFIMEFL